MRILDLQPKDTVTLSDLTSSHRLLLKSRDNKYYFVFFSTKTVSIQSVVTGEYATPPMPYLDWQVGKDSENRGMVKYYEAVLSDASERGGQVLVFDDAKSMYQYLGDVL